MRSIGFTVGCNSQASDTKLDEGKTCAGFGQASTLHEMFIALLNRAFDRFGYEIKRKLKSGDQAAFKLYSYKTNDGSFDYEKYRRIQEEGNIRKIKTVWVLEENVAFLSKHLRNRLSHIKFGLCHGTRRGKEQEWFRKYLGCEVIGTEISKTAEEFPHTIQWDFHDVKPEWLDAVDFIYSNSFDHSHDPKKCLNAWMSCLRKGGLCILEHSSENEARATSELDPFGADIILMPYLITKWAGGKYAVRELLPAPAKNNMSTFVNFIVIEKY